MGQFFPVYYSGQCHQERRNSLPLPPIALPPNLPESQPISILSAHRDIKVGPSFHVEDFLHSQVGTPGVKEAACLPDTGWSQCTVVDRSSGVGGVGWPAPSLSTKLPPPQGPSCSTYGCQYYLSLGQSQSKVEGRRFQVRM